MAAIFLDVKAAQEILDSDVRPIDIVTCALVGGVNRYACDWLTMASLSRIGLSVQMVLLLVYWPLRWKIHCSNVRFCLDYQL